MRSVRAELAVRTAEGHYEGVVGPIEHPDLPQCEPALVNVGWTLGNDCPYRCAHCYSLSARRRGANLEAWMVDRIVDQLSRLGVKTVNLGGNEPIFTNGLDASSTLLPYVIRCLAERGIVVGLTTSGITPILLERSHRDELLLLNDIDVSFDSPFEAEHNRNRGAALFQIAERALAICEEYHIDKTVVTAAMTWNFDVTHTSGLLDLARRFNAQIRINPLKPVEREHLGVTLSAGEFYHGFSYLMSRCQQIDLGEPLLAAASSHSGRGCPCGRTSFRIHSVTPNGRVPISPCVYLHEYKVGDLLRDDIFDIVGSPAFQSFRRRVTNPEHIPGCEGCAYLSVCRGGCAARSYLHNLFEHRQRSLFVKDPYCLRDRQELLLEQGCVFPENPELPVDKILVHRDYLCTWIGRPRASDARAERACPSRGSIL